jgi:hypothetical protein
MSLKKGCRMPAAIQSKDRRTIRIGILTASADILLAAGSQADPGVSGTYSTSESLDTKKSIRKIWSNFLAGYQQARNAAKSVVRQMQLTSSLAHSMEQNLRAWESVARRTEALLHADLWDENPIGLVENLEENLFQKTDALLYNRIPNARESSRQLGAARRQWINGLGLGEEPGPRSSGHSVTASADLVALSRAQRTQQTREKTAFEIRSAALSKTGARKDQMAYMTDNVDANLSALGGSLAQLPASEARTMGDMNLQLSENDFVQGQMGTRQDMDRLELYAHILLAGVTEYNRLSLASQLSIQPLVLISAELERRRKP